MNTLLPYPPPRCKRFYDAASVIKDVLQAPNGALSFENAYRTMYYITLKHDDCCVPELIRQLRRHWRGGKWLDNSRWGCINDCLLYAIRVSKHKDELMKQLKDINHNITVSGELWNQVVIKYDLPAEIDVSIRQYWMKR